jgi:hypothetical protein
MIKEKENAKGKGKRESVKVVRDAQGGNRSIQSVGDVWMEGAQKTLSAILHPFYLPAT